MFPKSSKNTPHSVALLPLLVEVDSLRCCGAYSFVPMEENQNEIWKEIEGENGRYFISSLGNVKSVINNKEKILKQSVNWNKRRTITFTKRGQNSRYSVHRLVAFAFIPNPENKPHINHINGIPWDNRVENLEWCTHLENIAHAHRTGLYKNCYGPRVKCVYNKTVGCYKSGVLVKTYPNKRFAAIDLKTTIATIAYYLEIKKEYRGFTFEIINNQSPKK